jgi:hypothetical protein
LNRLKVHTRQRIVEHRPGQPLVVGEVGERAALYYLGIANVAVYSAVMVVHSPTNLLIHEHVEWRTQIVESQRNLNRIFPSSEAHEETKVIIRIVLVSVQPNSRQSHCCLEVALIVGTNILEIESVGVVRTESVGLQLRKASN